MNAVVKQQPETDHPQPAVSESAAIFQIIERAARDPGVDLDKLDRLMAMRERMEQRAAEREFDAAMAEAQAEMRPVAHDAANPQTRSRYASYAALDKALRPIYTHHGFSLSFNTGEGTEIGSSVIVVCRVAHRGGHSRVYSIPMPADGIGAKGGAVMTKTHATGSAITYGMRYLLKMIFNIATGEDDDDGNAAGASSETGEVISDEQAQIIRKLIEETNTDIERLCAYFKIEAIPDLPASKFQHLVNILEKKRGEK